MVIRDILIILFSYLIGCFNTGYYYVHIVYKKDIRKTGTNVTGARNVSTVAGKKGFIITFLGDALKGALVVLICRLSEVNEIVTLICILMVLAGHIFPFQLKFSGGKGLSTAFGAFLAYNSLLILYWLIIFIIMFIFVRKATVTSTFALFVLPVILFIIGSPWSIIIFFILYAMLINYACRSNIKEYLEK